MPGFFVNFIAPLSRSACKVFQIWIFGLLIRTSLLNSVADPHRFDADPNLASQYGSDPDPREANQCGSMRIRNTECEKKELYPSAYRHKNLIKRQIIKKI
jgi:hypothetical protein